MPLSQNTINALVYLFGVVCFWILLPGIAWVFGLVQYVKAKRWLGGTRRVEARRVAWQEKVMPNGKKAYLSEIEFASEDGKPQRFCGGEVFSRKDDRLLLQPLTVLYLPGQPDQAVVDSFSERPQTILVFIPGIVASLICYYFWVTFYLPAIAGGR